MEVNSKDFWIKVREEVGNKLNFLCLLSPTFKSAWEYNKAAIKELGAEFLENTNQNAAFIMGEGVISLFGTTTGDVVGATWSVDDFYRLRIDFVDYCINKF